MQGQHGNINRSLEDGIELLSLRNLESVGYRISSFLTPRAVFFSAVSRFTRPQRLNSAIAKTVSEPTTTSARVHENDMKGYLPNKHAKVSRVLAVVRTCGNFISRHSISAENFYILHRSMAPCYASPVLLLSEPILETAEGSFAFASFRRRPCANPGTSVLRYLFYYSTNWLYMHRMSASTLSILHAQPLRPPVSYSILLRALSNLEQDVLFPLIET